jgi:two-component system, OmpR family, phosphate regulon sensor histidine kinase PhoR
MSSILIPRPAGGERQSLTPRIFTRLLGLFVLLLVFHTVVMELILRRLAERTAGQTFRALGSEMLWSGLIALFLALGVAAWIASGVSRRLRRITDFARRVAAGDLSARLVIKSQDEIAGMEAALNQTAERLGQSFAEIENRRQELAAMLDSMQEAVIAITPDSLVLWSNSVMQHIAGTPIRAGRPLVHAVRDPEVLACIRGALECREVRNGRANALAPGRIFEINAAPLPSGGALAVLHDVTGIEAAEKSRRDFIANVSHELRTPLTSIQGYVETLVEDPSPNPATTREFLGIILKNATRMNRLTEDLLALASVESPDYHVTPQPMRASALLEDAVESLGGMVADAGVELETAGAPENLVLADPDAMIQVFGNLIENAVKYAKAGKKIRAGARLTEAFVEFTVQDYGPGIPSEHLERIFERFYRVDKARSRESGGTGLGLAIIQHIVQAHGGRVWAESELGSGSQFHFTLPLAPGDAALHEAEGQTAITRAGG